jgi:radical SAM protein with 4Fe4S-binding SPASM domain
MPKRPSRNCLKNKKSRLGEAGVETAVIGEKNVAENSPRIPHVIAWNLTKRCNLECAHCYISAGPSESGEDELTTDEFRRIASEIIEINPAPMFILSGGEPLLRDDLDELVKFSFDAGATVVLGTNGTLLTGPRIDQLKTAGLTGVAVSIESLDSTYHDRFRRGHGALVDTLSAVDELTARKMDFVVQTTITKGNRKEIRSLVEWSAAQGAVSFNAYFLVETGRGANMSDLSPQEYEEALTELVDLHVEFMGRMMVRSKCAPHFMRLVHERAPDSPIKNYSTRCPCGVHYCRVTPDGKLTACPYLPVPAGDLRQESFGAIWNESELFRTLRAGQLGGKCGACEYRAVCGGCRARSFASTGDFMHEDPSCAFEPSGDEPLVEPAVAATYGAPVQTELIWSDGAKDRMKRVPSFVRGVVMGRMEDYARKQGRSEITVEMLKEIRSSMPIDFSKRKPFFLNDE